LRPASLRSSDDRWWISRCDSIFESSLMPSTWEASRCRWVINADKHLNHGYYLVYENFELDALVHLVGLQYCVLELGQRLVVVILCVDDED